MPNFAVIKNNKVINVIVADNKTIAENVTGDICIEILAEPGQPGIGWAYENEQFIAPPSEEPIRIKLEN